MIDFSGRVAAVTGGSRGIGAATARRLAALGARVGIAWRADHEAAAALVAELGAAAAAWPADVTDDAAVAAFVRGVVERWGRLDVLVANAGIWEGAPIERMAPAAWARMVDVNLTGTFRTLRHAVAPLKAAGGGSIVVVSSTAGQRGEAGHAHYAATKGAQIALVKSLAVELAPEIRVNAVAPGWVDTDMSEAAIASDRERILGEIPLGRVATADDVADAIAFLASDRARHVTGEVLNVNGGSVLCG